MKYTPDIVEWKLRHLAFPLSVNHNFLGGYVVNFFVSAGIMPEIRFYYNEYTTYMTGNKVESSHLWTSSEFRALAFSTSGSLGMRINFAEKWGLEIEPSCRYYVASLHPDFLRRPLCFTVGTGFYYFW